MKKYTHKIQRFVKNYKISIPVLVVVLIIAGVVASHFKKPEVKSEFITAARTTISQEVTVTGRVKPSTAVDLAVQSGGKVVSIPAQVGKEVKSGAVLLRVDDSDLRIRLARQQATVEKAQLALSKQQPNAQDNLNKAYEDGFNAINDTFTDLPTIISELHDILYTPSHSPYLSNENVRNISDTAASMKMNVGVTFDQTENAYNSLLKQYQSFNRSASPQELNGMLNSTYVLTKNVADVVKNMRSLISYIEDRTKVTPAELTTDKATLDTYTQKTNDYVSQILTVQNSIKNLQNNTTDEAADVQSSQIDIRQAQLDIQDTLVQINQRTIKAPVDGIVTKVNAEVGETISPSSPVISVISSNQYEIEANLPEADVAKIKVGADADITLDAYGSDVIFKAKVSAINPAETLIDGVATYTTTFQFIEKDDRIKSGMTADITVHGDKKANVIAIPQRAVITKNNTKYVQILDAQNKTIDTPVETGMRGSDGSIEITSGINEGDKVVVFNDTTK